MLDPMDMTMDVYEVNDFKDWWETDLEVSRNPSISLIPVCLLTEIKNFRMKSTWAVSIIIVSYPPTRALNSKWKSRWRIFTAGEKLEGVIESSIWYEVSWKIFISGIFHSKMPGL